MESFAKIGKNMKVDVIAKNLLSGCSCENCFVEREVQYALLTQGKRIIKSYNCKGKIALKKDSGFYFKSPKNRFCENWREI